MARRNILNHILTLSRKHLTGKEIFLFVTASEISRILTLRDLQAYDHSDSSSFTGLIGQMKLLKSCDVLLKK